MKELSLRPYHGRLFVASSKSDYASGHVELFKTPDILTCAQVGRFTGGEGKDGMWTYLVWSRGAPQRAREISHVLFHVFDRCGIDPRDSGGEAFCYMRAQLILEAR